MYKRISGLMLFGIVFQITMAQNYTAAPTKVGDWRLFEVPTGINFALLREYSHSYQKAILNLGDDQVIISAWHGSTGYSLIRMDNNANILWRSKVPGYILGSAKWKDKVIAFYTKEWDLSHFLDGTHILEVSAITVDLATGKKIVDKVVFRNESKKAIQPIIHSQPDGEFVQLLIRQTKNSKKERDDNWATANATVINLSENLAAIPAEIKNTEALKGNYIGSLVNSKRETFIVTQSGKKLITEKFDSKFAATGRLVTEMNLENEGVHIRLDEHSDQSLLVAVRQGERNKVQLALYNFNFNGGNVTQGNFTLDKDQIRSWGDKSKETGHKKADFDRDLFNLKMSGLLQAGDKIIVLFDEIKANIEGGTYNNGPTVIIFFDRKLSVLSSQAISKNFYIATQPPIRDWTLGAHVYGNQLVLVSNEGTKTKEQSAVITTIDLGTMKIGEPFYTEKNRSIVEGGATIWFKKNFVLTRTASDNYRVVSF